MIHLYNPKIQKKVAKMRSEGHTYDEIGHAFGFSRETARQIAKLSTVSSEKNQMENAKKDITQ